MSTKNRKCPLSGSMPYHAEQQAERAISNVRISEEVDMVGEEQQAKHQQRGVFGRTELQRYCGKRRRDQRQHDDAERAGDP